MVNITPAGWEKAVKSGAADSVLRISKRTGDVTTARHGFFSRLVRWVRGPTKQDIRDNKEILTFARKDLKKSFGRDLAEPMLLRARERFPDSELDPRKPLSVRQVRTAHRLAIDGTDRSKQSLDWGTSTQIVRAQRAIESQQGTKLSRAQLNLFTTRLGEEVRDAANRNRVAPDNEATKEIARKLQKRVASLTDEVASGAAEKIIHLRSASDQLFNAMIWGCPDNGSPIALLSSLITQSENLADVYADIHEEEEEEEEEEYALMPGPGGVDDPRYARRPAWRAMDRTMAAISTAQARGHFESAMRDGSEARRIYTTIAGGALNADGRSQSAAVDEFRNYFWKFLTTLGTEAGIPADQANKRVYDLITEIDKEVEVENEQVADEEKGSWAYENPLMLIEYEKHLEERSRAFDRQWAENHPEGARRRLDAAVRKEMNHFNPMRNTKGFRKALEAREVEAALSDDQGALVSARLEEHLRHSGTEFPERKQIAALVAEITRTVADMDDREVAGELAARRNF